MSFKKSSDKYQKKFKRVEEVFSIILFSMSINRKLTIVLLLFTYW